MSSASTPDTAAATITRDELIRALRRRRVVLVDVLAPESFAAIHIPGAINLPVADISRLAPQLLPDRRANIVAYCGGPT
jgi:rhodanese-related sulfurtransferase